MCLKKNLKKKPLENNFFPHIKISSNIDSRAVWRLLQRPVFLSQKPGTVTRFHETSLNDQLFYGPDLTTNFISKLLLQQKKTNTQVWL